MKTINPYVILSALVAVMLFSSCQKEEITEPEERPLVGQIVLETDSASGKFLLPSGDYPDRVLDRLDQYLGGNAFLERGPKFYPKGITKRVNVTDSRGRMSFADAEGDSLVQGSYIYMATMTIPYVAVESERYLLLCHGWSAWVPTRTSTFTYVELSNGRYYIQTEDDLRTGKCLRNFYRLQGDKRGFYTLMLENIHWKKE